MSDGDSITNGQGLNELGQRYPSQAEVPLSINDSFANVAVNGATSANVIGHLSTAVTPQLTSWASTNGPVIYTLMIGADDIFNGVTPATVYSNIQSICSTVTAVGSTKFVIFTVLPASTVNETNRQSLNTLIRNGGSCSMTVADVGNDPTIGQAGDDTNTTYYQADQVHPTAAGQQIVALKYMLPALQSLGVN